LLLVQAWLLAFSYEFHSAVLKLNEVEAIQGDDQTIGHLVAVLHGFVAVQQGTVPQTIANRLTEAIAFFEEYHMLIQASSAQLIWAWHHAIQGDGIAAKQILDNVQGAIRNLGHAAHLFRFYELSLPFLGGWWDADVVNLLTQAERQYQLGTGHSVRVYAFGIPRIYVNGHELTQRDRYGKVGVKLLLFMLEKRKARFWEIIDAIYPDADPDTVANRFHSAMSTFRKGIDVPDWCLFDSHQQLYVVKGGFPHYYDVDNFNVLYHVFSESKTPIELITVGLRLVNLYKVFAETLEGDVFDELRTHYEARYDRIVFQMQDHLGEIAPLIPSAWYERLHQLLIGYS
jgi:hypothetical protein